MNPFWNVKGPYLRTKREEKEKEKWLFTTLLDWCFIAGTNPTMRKGNE
jgi:hypothetical protein